MSAPTRSRAEFTVTGQRITWLCAVCHEPIRKGAGYLEVDRRKAVERRRETNRFMAEHRQPGGYVTFNGAETMMLASRVPWLPHHRSCDPRPDESGYWIAVERIDSLRKLIHWAGHLAGKDWINSTSWSSLLQGIGGPA